MSEFTQADNGIKDSLEEYDQSSQREREQTPTSSSTSSYVPVDSVQDAIQLIDEDKKFNDGILDYINSLSGSNDEHRIISVFGSQSTGKSTLLNALFNTNFGVMNENNRQQTTKGIWLALSPGVSNCVSDHNRVSQSNILVMDVEGTDGRERGEDQDFERKAALFALATSEILIVNLWETQVGLYQGANMGLLKTVFEVNLSLFGTAKLHSNSDHKVLLLFVIRDHLGVTPKESLAATITQDLLKIWDSLNKPAEVAHLAFEDFFDLAFHTLSHKVLQNDKFIQDVRLLGNRFIDPEDEAYLFKPFYHHDIPIEGWTMYAENCWDQIDNNKDLDLPTQQILVAKFKCDEIVSSCMSEFLADFDTAKLEAVSLVDSGADLNYKDIELKLSSLRNAALNRYDTLASKYNTTVYEQRRQILSENINTKLSEIISLYSKRLLSTFIKSFTSDLSKKTRNGTFTEYVVMLTEKLTLEFAETLALLSLGGELNTNEYAENLEEEVGKIILKQQIVELNQIVNKHLKRLSNSSKVTILEEIANPSDLTWDHILDKFNSLTSSTLDKYTTPDGKYDFEVGCSRKLNELTADVIEFKSWALLHDILKKNISRANFLNFLKERFDDKFRYDANGVPRLYENAKDLEMSFAEAKEYAMKIFPVLSFARLSNGAEVIPKMDIGNKRLIRKYESVKLEEGSDSCFDGDEEESSDSEEDDDLKNRRCFAEILSEREKSDVLVKFKKEIDAKFVETKRSIVQHVTQIPYYIYLVILVLGWNEFMAVLRNPFFFSLLLVAGAGLYMMYQMNLLRPALVVSQRLIDETISVGKQKLREVLLDENDFHGRNLEKIGESKNSHELQDLNAENHSEILGE